VLGEGSFLVSENNRAHLVLGTASMVTIGGHSMVSEYDQSGLVVHFLNDLVEDFFRVNDLSLNFGVLRTVSVASAINTDNVSEHEREITSGIEFFVDIISHILVKRV
jgi:hypothetical protein